VISAFILSACSHASFKEESKATIKTVKETLKEKTKKSNKNSEKLRFYLPFGFEIKDQSPNNIILKDGSKTYILFNNPQENASSDVVYKASVSQYKKPEINETFKGENSLGYLIIEKLKDDMNEMTIGIGGTKITTQTKTSRLKDEAQEMMQIAKSLKVAKEAK
jgi:hypothetical protein